MTKIKVGIVGAAGYTGGELIRILIHHPNVIITFVHSRSQANTRVSAVHHDLLGECDLYFTNQYTQECEVVFLCLGHGESAKIISDFPPSLKIIDLSQDFRINTHPTRNFIYGLPELNRNSISTASNIANPGCFATAVQLALLPLAQKNLLQGDIHINATTGSTGAGQSLSDTSHFSYRQNNLSAYKAFTHQHLDEIHQSLNQLQSGPENKLIMVPMRGSFTRGILAAINLSTQESLESLKDIFNKYYTDHPFVWLSEKNIDLKQVVNTNKCFLYLEKHGDQLMIISVIDNLLKGASGQAVQNMNLMYGLEETTGLKLKASAFKSVTMKPFDVYHLFDIEISKALGSTLWDNKGNTYLDLYGGHAVISIGHTHPHYVAALTAQLQNIGFYSNSIQIELQHVLAEKLGRLSGYPEYQLFLCNSGAEANENALKLASFQNGRKKVIAFKGGFHGRTSLAVAATDNPSIVAPVNESNNIVFLPLNDLAAVEKEIDEHTCAVIVEGIQGVSGIQIPDPGFLQKVASLCKAKGALLILDEVQSGYGRTGKFFAHQHAEIKPDMITVAKGMGNGFPVGGVLISPDIEAKKEMLGTTFGGSYLACTAAIAVLEVIEKENLMDNALIMGEYLMKRLQGLPHIKEIRGQGLMIGIELDEPCATIRKEMLFRHFIFTGSASNKNTIRILPSLAITKKEIDAFIDAFMVTLTQKELV